MTEEERLAALGKLRGFVRSDRDLGMMVSIVCRESGVPNMGHLARFHPEVFDDLYEEMEAMATG